MDGPSPLAAASSLKQRTLTALLLGPISLAAILWLPTALFALVLGAIFLAAAWEWGGLAGLAERRHRWLYLGAVAAILLLLWLVPDWRRWAIGAAVLWWAVQAASLARPGPIVAESAPDPGLFAAGILILASPWAAMVELHGLGQAGPALVLLLVLLVWTADSLAYFAGRRFGRTKLAPLVSPGKTREGVYAALAGGLLWGLPLGWLTGLDWRGTGLAALVCLVAVAASVVGDLYESLQKRRRGMKDAGSLLPGHGGMLDRVDSLTAAAPVFALGIALVGGLA